MAPDGNLRRLHRTGNETTSILTAAEDIGNTFIKAERRCFSLPGVEEYKERADNMANSVLPLAAAFDKFDEDSSGGIDANELRGALRYLGIGVDTVQAQALLDSYDKYPDRSLDAKEFAALVRDVRLLLKFDANSDGVLDSSELLEALTSLGLDADAKLANDIMRHFDSDHDGTIDLLELSALVKTVLAFVKYDVDKSGTIDEDELREAMRRLGLRIGSLDSSTVFRRYDADGNGSLDVVEFAVLVRDLQLFVDYDTDFNGTLDADELSNAFKQLGFHQLGPGGASTSAVAVLAAWDEDDNGTIDLGEFTQMVADLRAFKDHDEGRKGQLERIQLWGALVSLGLDTYTEDAQEYLLSLPDNIPLLQFAGVVRNLKSVMGLCAKPAEAAEAEPAAVDISMPRPSVGKI